MIKKEQKPRTMPLDVLTAEDLGQVKELFDALTRAGYDAAQECLAKGSAGSGSPWWHAYRLMNGAAEIFRIAADHPERVHGRSAEEMLKLLFDPQKATGLGQVQSSASERVLRELEIA